MIPLSTALPVHPSRSTDNLLRKMWKTKSARFNAHARLMSRQRLSTAATSALACYLIAVSILQLTLPAAAEGALGKIITSAVLILSVFLLMITLIESARNYGAEADKMHRSALEIAELYNRFQALDLAAADAARSSFNDQYSAILRSSEVIHKDIDALRFQLAHRQDLKPSLLTLTLTVFRFLALWVIEYALYIAMIVMPLLLAFPLLGGLGLYCVTG